jgi:mRNA interferase RelE/StbE
MGYKVFIEKLAQKELLNIPKNDQNRIIEAIQALSKNPRPHNVKKLSGREAWRIRVGKYRIIYEIDDGKLTILVILVGHRKEIYRK